GRGRGGGGREVGQSRGGGGGEGGGRPRRAAARGALGGSSPPVAIPLHSASPHRFLAGRRRRRGGAGRRLARPPRLATQAEGRSRGDRARAPAVSFPEKTDSMTDRPPLLPAPTPKALPPPRFHRAGTPPPTP